MQCASHLQIKCMKYILMPLTTYALTMEQMQSQQRLLEGQRKGSKAHTAHHNTLFTLHSTLHISHFTLHTSRSPLHTSHFTFSHSPPHTFHTPPSIQHTSHFYALHPTLDTPHFPHQTPHFLHHTLLQAKPKHKRKNEIAPERNEVPCLPREDFQRQERYHVSPY